MGVESRRLDIDLQSLQIGKDHLLEKCAATPHEILLDRRAQAEEPLTGVLGSAHGVEMTRPVGKLDEVSEGGVPPERFHRRRAPSLLRGPRCFRGKPGSERRVIRDPAVAGAPVQTYPIPAK